MGCDGGTIPTRDELVRLKKKPEQVRFIKYASGLLHEPLHLYLGHIK